MRSHRVRLLRSQYQTNVFGTLDVTTAVLPYMRKRGSVQLGLHAPVRKTLCVLEGSGTVVMIGSRSAWRTELKVQ